MFQVNINTLFIKIIEWLFGWDISDNVSTPGDVNSTTTTTTTEEPSTTTTTTTTVEPATLAEERISINKLINWLLGRGGE
jgi:hypothetical protein